MLGAGIRVGVRDRPRSAARPRTAPSACPHQADRLLAHAQIHATLALAAATALGTSPTESRAWADVAGTKFSAGGPKTKNRTAIRDQSFAVGFLSLDPPVK
jgi:hypothetical protein